MMNRSALITGGAKRVGLAVARHLLGLGWRVVITYRTHTDVVDELASQGVQTIPADLMNTDAVERIVAALGAGPLHLLLNNASVYATDQRLSLQDAMIVNCEAPVALIHALADALRAGGGAVVNMLDILSMRPIPSYSNYCASKAALWSQTLALARSLAPEVTVNGIAPGVVEWPDDMPDDQREKYLAKVPLRRAGTGEDVAHLVEFLATRGRYITGQVTKLDGGRSITW